MPVTLESNSTPIVFLDREKAASPAHLVAILSRVRTVQIQLPSTGRAGAFRLVAPRSALSTPTPPDHPRVIPHSFP